MISNIDTCWTKPCVRYACCGRPGSRKETRWTGNPRGQKSIPWWIDPFNINDFSGGRKIRGIFSCMPWSLLKYFTWLFSQMILNLKDIYSVAVTPNLLGAPLPELHGHSTPKYSRAPGVQRPSSETGPIRVRSQKLMKTKSFESKWWGYGSKENKTTWP